MCKAHSKVTHIKQQNIFITSSALDIIQSSYYNYIEKLRTVYLKLYKPKL